MLNLASLELSTSASVELHKNDSLAHYKGTHSMTVEQIAEELVQAWYMNPDISSISLVARGELVDTIAEAIHEVVKAEREANIQALLEQATKLPPTDADNPSFSDGYRVAIAQCINTLRTRNEGQS